MQISIKKTADVDVSKSLIEELQKTLGKEDSVIVEVLDLLNEAADKLESHDEFSKIYDDIIDVIKSIADESNDEKDIVEIKNSDDIEENVQEEIEEQKKK